MANVTSNRNESSFGELFDQNYQFVIPPFQRPYTWKKKHLEQLKLDIDGLVDGEESVHFMGAIIDDSRVGDGATDIKTYELIDGQQRVTTVYLLVCAAASVYLSLGETDEALGLAESYIFLRRKGQLHTKVVPSMTDRQDMNLVLSAILAEGLAETKGLNGQPFQALQKTNTSGQVLKNFETFKKILKQIHKDLGLTRLRNFVSSALESLHVVEIVVQDPSAGPKIFDSLNSRQAPITTGDLVRNEIFSKVALSDSDKAISLDAELWSPFYTSFSRPGLDERDAFDKFFFPLGLIYNNSLKKNEVFTHLQKIWRGKEPREILSDLEKFSVPYQDLIFGENKSGFRTKELQIAVQNVYLMKAPSVSLPFFMKLLSEVKNGFDEIVAAKIIFEVEAFLVRRALCSIEPTGLHAVFKKLWNSLEGELTPDKVKESLMGEKTVEYPNDEKVLASFKSPLYKKGICKYFLWAFEHSLNGDRHSKDDFKSFWIEHVLPQNPDSKTWKEFSKDDHKKLVDFAGNLIPLTSEMNGGLGNKEYVVKQSVLKSDSKYKSARVLADTNKTWLPHDLDKRNESLAKWSIKYW
jgi:uncharacterized protein with ParB-like and HNH nuclease domain